PEIVATSLLLPASCQANARVHRDVQEIGDEVGAAYDSGTEQHQRHLHRIVSLENAADEVPAETGYPEDTLDVNGASHDRRRERHANSQEWYEAVSECVHDHHARRGQSLRSSSLDVLLAEDFQHAAP